MRERPKRASAPEQMWFSSNFNNFPYNFFNFLNFLKLFDFLEMSLKSQNFPKYEEISFI